MINPQTYDNTTVKDIETTFKDKFENIKCPECKCEDLLIFRYEVTYSSGIRRVDNLVLACRKCHTRFNKNTIKKFRKNWED